MTNSGWTDQGVLFIRRGRGPGLSFKADVRLVREIGGQIVMITRRCLEAMAVASCVYWLFKYDCIVTSVLDGQHKTGSWHYLGEACDLRTSHVDVQVLPELHAALRNALPKYDVLLEKDHIHIEPAGPQP